MSNFTQEELDTLYNEVDEFVPYKFFCNLFDEMSYHGYDYESHDVNEIVQLVFKKQTAAQPEAKKSKRNREGDRINVLIIFHEKQNKHYLLSRKMDFDKNIRRYIDEGAENLIIYDSEDVEKSAIKHTKSMTDSKFVFRGADSYICNINNTLSKGYSIATESEIKHIETMRVLPNFSSVVPLIDENDVICRMLRVKTGDIIKYDGLDPAIKSFIVKYFLVR